MKRYTMLFDWKNQYRQNDCIVQSNLQIQCHLHQITNGHFLDLEQKKTQNVYVNIEYPKYPNQSY